MRKQTEKNQEDDGILGVLGSQLDPDMHQDMVLGSQFKISKVIYS
jgi:hypothetical protein